MTERLKGYIVYNSHDFNASFIKLIPSGQEVAFFMQSWDFDFLLHGEYKLKDEEDLFGQLVSLEIDTSEDLSKYGIGSSPWPVAMNIRIEEED
jgi:hypothetical protein